MLYPIMMFLSVVGPIFVVALAVVIIFRHEIAYIVGACIVLSKRLPHEISQDVEDGKNSISQEKKEVYEEELEKVIRNLTETHILLNKHRALLEEASLLFTATHSTGVFNSEGASEWQKHLEVLLLETTDQKE